MSSTATAHHDAEHHDHEHGYMYYIKIWGLLLVLLVISVLGPELGNKVITLITAFGIAIVKATIVAAYFMHLKDELKYIWYMFFTMLALMLVFYFGISPDVQYGEGHRWEVTSPYQANAYEYTNPSYQGLEKKAVHAKEVAWCESWCGPKGCPEGLEFCEDMADHHGGHGGHGDGHGGGHGDASYLRRGECGETPSEGCTGHYEDQRPPKQY